MSRAGADKARRPADDVRPLAMPDLARMEGAVKAPLPREVAPELATLAEEAPRGEGWIYELKYDGYRVLSWLRDGKASFLTRNGKDWTAQFSALGEAVESIPARSAILDGEVAVLGPNGATDFQALQNALREGSAANLVYFVFDLLYLDGYDLRRARLRDRKAALAALLSRANGAAKGRVRYSDHLEGDGALVHKKACQLALEGVVAKRFDSTYRSGRGRDWLKLKCGTRQEVVIGGYTDPGGSRQGFGALLLGVHEPSGALRYAGKVGTGFSGATLAQIAGKLRAIERDEPPFADPLRMRDAHWVKPDLVAEVQFTGWTNGGHMRHPSFLGLREDRRPVGIVREVPQPAKPAKSPKAAKGAKAAKVVKAAKAAKAAKTEPAPATSAKPRAKDRPAPLEIEGVTISSPDKVLYPDKGLTKLDVARYYERVAGWILPQISERPLTLVRCPAGYTKQSFFQKHAADGMSPAIQTIELKDKEGSDKYISIDSAAGLFSLVQMSALELHVWGSRTDRVEQPDRLIFDLDPAPELSFGDVIVGALEVRERLLAMGLRSFVKTTGGKGLHIVLPITPGRADWDDCKAFTKALAVSMAGDSPGRYTATMSKAKRTDKIFIDYLRNSRGATSVCAYSTRAKPGATVATPIAWEELTEGFRPDQFTIETVPDRLEAMKQDPWADLASVRQSLSAAASLR